MEEIPSTPQTPPPDKDYFAPNGSPPNKEIYKSPSRILLKFIGMALVFVIIIGAAGSWLFKDVIFKKPTLQPTPTPDMTKIVPPTDPTADWKTYRNETFGFEYQYPSNLHLFETTPPDSEEDPDFLASIGLSPDKDNKTSIISLGIRKNSVRLSPLDYWSTKDIFWSHGGNAEAMSQAERRSETQKHINNMEDIKIGNTNITGFKVTYPSVLANTSTYWFDGDKVYNLSFSPEDKSYKYSAQQKEAIVSQILSTFKFIESETQTGTISWSQAVSLINGCKVSTVMQTHSLDVTLSLKEGKQVITKEPKIDEIFKVVKNAEDTCGQMPLATE